jgi:preprotein translocase subunit SecE
MSKISPAQFLQEVRQEATKVTWPTRKETGISTAMVFVFVILAAVFFLIVDQLLQIGVKLIFGFGV